MRRSRRSVMGALTGALIGALAVPAAGAAQPREVPDVQGEQRASKARDAREGRRPPTERQQQLARDRGLTARWHALGTPRLLAGPAGEPLRTGLPQSPEAAARAFLHAERELLGLSADEVDRLELLVAAPLGDDGAAVVLRQTFGDLPAGRDGLVSVGVRNGAAVFLSSSLTRDGDVRPASALLDAAEGVARAARDAGLRVDASDVRMRGVRAGWGTFDAAGLDGPARARLAAVPTPADGVRAAWAVVLVEDVADEPLGVQTFVDARTGDVLVREDLVDHAADDPAYSVFPSSPRLDGSSADIRELWCWAGLVAGCQRVLQDSASPLGWDVDPSSGAPTGRTRGNNARATEKWHSNSSSAQGTNYTTAPTRDFTFAWTDQWRRERCNPDTTFTSPQRNDLDAAATNLFAMHNRMHDWAYHLGFTEQTWNLQEDNFGRGGLGGDPEHGNVQAGGVVGGPPGYASRDNANQITPPDGTTPVTNMYLWQPIAGAFYSPCVDGDYDMSVIGHEYGHAISNRMVAGPDGRLSGNQGNGMGESWSDLVAVEHLAAHGFAPPGDASPWAVGPYVTGDPDAGIRNHNMARSPLNYSDIGYDLVGTQVHADGEIWSATNFDLRRAFIARYDATAPSSDASLQAACAAGATPVADCPGNRRWMQLVFDAWLLMANGAVTMVDARDAMLAADQVRFGGANQDLLWDAFARRGLGEGASSPGGTNDPDPVPSFASPLSAEGTLTLVSDTPVPPVAQLFVGRYEARATPVADTDPATALGPSVQLVAGTYDLLIRGAGLGTRRATVEVRAGQARDLPLNGPPNVASAAAGATASGDGANHLQLIDETEATQWVAAGGPVAGRQVTVRLDPSRPARQVRRVQVSALLRPANPADPGDPGSQNRFTALRSFEVLTCLARAGTDCSSDADFSVVLRSAGDAFPAVAPRPRAPDLVMRSFDVPQTRATHVRLRVLTNQCTGAAAYAGDQDDDPRHVTDCAAGSSADQTVRVAELQVFER